MSGGGASAGTKGFLFCDLRGYTAFVERRGDQAAAELLATYREPYARSSPTTRSRDPDRGRLASTSSSRPPARRSRPGLGIVAAAAEASTREAPIRVGVGIHAGETVATTEGLVGGAVNIAARVCAKAQAGEVLVTDTVRALDPNVPALRLHRPRHPEPQGHRRGDPALPGRGRPIELRPGPARAASSAPAGGVVAILAGPRRRRPRGRPAAPMPSTAPPDCLDPACDDQGRRGQDRSRPATASWRSIRWARTRSW